MDDFIYDNPVTFMIMFTFGCIFGGLVLVSAIYNLSGAAQRDKDASFECKAKGGNEIYIKGTGTVCLKSDAIINVR